MTKTEKYEAVLQNEARYDGIFFYAVKSTGIFCRPSCKSKAPKRENVCFYDSAQEAQEAGFRPCKRCRSDLLLYSPAEDLALQMKTHIDQQFQEEISWQEAYKTLHVSPQRLADMFQAKYGLRPKHYLDNLRLEEAKHRLIKSDEPIIDIAYTVGFGSLSTFYRLFKAQTGTSPSAYRKEQADE